MVVRRRHVVELPERAAPPPRGEPREDRARFRCHRGHAAASRVRERGLLRGRSAGPRRGPRQVLSRRPRDRRERDPPRRRERGRQGGHRLLDRGGGLRDRRRRGRPRQHLGGRCAGVSLCEDRGRTGDGVTRLFGTNGIRGVIGPEMNADLAVKVGRAIGTFVSGGAVALARDPRLSGPMLARAAASGLMSAGCDVIDLGLVPTPCAQYFVAKSGQVKGAIVVTASHNPREFNGLKAIDSRGMEMRREDEEAIESIFFESRFHVAPWSEVGSIRADDAAIHRYTEGVLSKVDGDAIRKRAPSVVVDPGNGAGCVMTLYLLRSLGCRVLSMNAQPDGAFPARPPEPTPDHLGDLMRVVSEVHADLGIAHDGDADRATFVDDKGSFVYGDKSLALLAKAAIQGRGGTVVTPVSTSSLIDDVVRAAGGRVVRTRVGSPIVARTRFETGAALGGEENGGVIFPDHQFCRDGAMSAAKMLELLAQEGKRLSSLTAALPQYHLKKANVSVPVEKREAVLASLVELTKGRKVDTTDGVKIVEPDGAVLVRPSGTEPIFRVYAEARTPERADALAAEGADLIQKALGRR